MKNGNIWSDSFRISIEIYVYLIGYCAIFILVQILDEYFHINHGKAIGLVFASAMLAIPAHLSILSQLKPSEAMLELQRKNAKYIRTFFMRTFALCLVALFPTFVLVFILIGMNFGNNAAIITISLFVQILGALIFTKWGTMLPAVLMQDDSTFSRAGRRGKLSFSYALPRLLISIVFLTIIQLFVAILSVKMLGAGEYFVPETGGFDFPLLFSMLPIAFLNGYQIIMVSVILSRAYLLAEKAESQGGPASA